MDTEKNYLQVMQDSLDKKLEIMKQLDELTDRQKEIAEADEFDDVAFESNVEAKGALVDKLVSLDKGFQITYDNIKVQLDQGREKYKDQINELKKRIQVVTDYSVTLQAKEARNKKLIEERFAVLKKEVRTAKRNRQVAANYYKTMNNISAEPYFLDKKK